MLQDLHMPGLDQFDEDPGIDGPDYVSLVIEWPEEAATMEVTDEVTHPTRMTRVRALTRTLAMHKTAAALGALAVAYVAWRVHRHRAAC